MFFKIDSKLFCPRRPSKMRELPVYDTQYDRFDRVNVMSTACRLRFHKNGNNMLSV